MLPKINPTTTKAWKALQLHFEETKNLHMRDLFASDSQRFDKYHVKLDGFLFDYSKNRITDKTKELLIQLCEEVKLKEAIHSQFFGDKINETEDRSVLHTALRNQSNTPVFADGEDVMPNINRVLEQMKTFTDKLHKGQLKGFSGKRITDVINLGVGGSDLGAYMTVEALKPFQDNVRVQFVSNVDGTQLVERLKKVDQETTLFIVVSKTFTTQETMTNAESAKKWFLQKANRSDVFKHFVAVSSNIEEVENFGIDKDNIFEFWDWVGGRFSLWSAVGLSICCALGFEQYRRLLEGAHEMDKHFYEADFSENIPVLMGALGVWYNNFYKSPSYAVLPYDQYMYRLTGYLQQADMESNGKSIDRNGEQVTYETGAVLFGEPGTNSQHAFFQLIHQGTKLIPSDFIASIHTFNDIGDHHNKLLANFLAQTEALMTGKSEKEVIEELKLEGKSEAEIKQLLPFKVFEGNKPSNTFLLQQLTPKTLGMLIAAYEHKIFVQGVIWNIFSYDQWGVELGKQLANQILLELNSNNATTTHDSSTNSLLSFIKLGNI